MIELEEFGKAYTLRKLSEGERVNQFDCDDEDLNDFIENEASAYRQEMLAITYVLTHKEDKRIAAFFSLANDRISLTDFEDKTSFNRFRRKRFVNEKRLRSYPAVKLCRLGVDKDFRGKSIGTFILHFIKTFFSEKNKTGCRFITVDAYPAALAFYEKNGFAPLSTEDENDPTRLLFFDLKDVTTPHAL